MDTGLSDNTDASLARKTALPSLHLPFALLASAIAVMLIWQTMSMFKQRTAMQEAKIQLADAFQKRDVLVKQSGELQNKFQALVVDLLALGKTDEDAKTIIAKYNIQQTAPANPAP